MEFDSNLKTLYTAIIYNSPLHTIPFPSRRCDLKRRELVQGWVLLLRALQIRRRCEGHGAERQRRKERRWVN